jgi:hypothetical protein
VYASVLNSVEFAGKLKFFETGQVTFLTARPLSKFWKKKLKPAGEIVETGGLNNLEKNEFPNPHFSQLEKRTVPTGDLR